MKPSTIFQKITLMFKDSPKFPKIIYLAFVVIRFISSRRHHLHFRLHLRTISIKTFKLICYFHSSFRSLVSTLDRVPSRIQMFSMPKCASHTCHTWITWILAIASLCQNMNIPTFHLRWCKIAAHSTWMVRKQCRNYSIRENNWHSVVFICGALIFPLNEARKKIAKV